MKRSDVGSAVLGFRGVGIVAVACVAGAILIVSSPVKASSPTGHIIISEQVIARILADPNANPELKAILSDPAARKAFSGGACAPDLDSLAEQAHTSSPKATADAIMATARAKLAKAQAALDKATTADQRDRAEKVLKQAKCDIAFAYGWRCHAAADIETHPSVNASGKNYWDDETRNRFQEQKDQIAHGEWETMQEANWVNKYGPPKDPNVDYRLGLLEEALGFEHDDLLNDVKTLSNKEYGAKYVGDKYPQSMLDDWKKKNDVIGDRSIDRSLDWEKSPGNPIDDSCWDVGAGIPVEDFRKFIEDTKKANGGILPDSFFDDCNTKFFTWKKSGGGSTGGTAGTTTPSLPPPLSGGTSGSGTGTLGGSGGPRLNKFR
ncbi:MAG: zinc dependent phospholipase C family protein [bacterium]